MVFSRLWDKLFWKKWSEWQKHIPETPKSGQHWMKSGVKLWWEIKGTTKKVDKLLSIPKNIPEPEWEIEYVMPDHYLEEYGLDELLAKKWKEAEDTDDRRAYVRINSKNIVDQNIIVSIKDITSKNSLQATPICKSNLTNIGWWWLQIKKDKERSIWDTVQLIFSIWIHNFNEKWEIVNIDSRNKDDIRFGIKFTDISDEKILEIEQLVWGVKRSKL